MSLLEAAKAEHAGIQLDKADWLLSRTSFSLSFSWQWVNVVYLLIQIVGELLVKNGQLIATAPSSPEDSASLQWLMRELLLIHHKERDIGSQNMTELGPGVHQDSQLKNWVLAGICYALLLASLPELHKRDAHSGLHQLQAWWEERVNTWMESLDLPGSLFALEVLEKIEWLTTVEGESIIQQLYDNSLVSAV